MLKEQYDTKFSVLVHLNRLRVMCSILLAVESVDGGKTPSELLYSSVFSGGLLVSAELDLPKKYLAFSSDNFFHVFLCYFYYVSIKVMFYLLPI